MEGPWLVDWFWEAHVTFFLLHNKLLQVAIWLGMWTVSLSRVLTTWQTLVCWYVIYLCEVISQGVWYFGSTLCTWTWYQSIYEEPLLVLIKIWNWCFWNFERVSSSRFFVHLWHVGAIPLHLECHFHWEIVFVSSKTVSVFWCFIKVFGLLGVPYVPEHGIRAFMKSRFQFWSRSGTEVAENCSCLFQKHPFQQIWRYNGTVTDLFF